MATARGFEIFCPDERNRSDKIALFRSASCIIGEHGSGMHASVFANPGITVATIGAWNKHQFHIANAFDHHLICMNRHTISRGWDTPPFQFDVTDDDLTAWFEMIETAESGKLLDFDATRPDAGSGVLPAATRDGGVVNVS